MAAQLQGSESNDISPLTEDETRKLVDACFEAKSNAHAPYSKFKVGSALLTDDGTIYTGCSVDNSAYSLCICAEVCAIVKAVSDGKKKFRAISVATDSEDIFASPCGSCRQVMSEFGVDFWVVLTKPDRTTRLHKVKELLPFSFSDEDLRAGQSK